MPDDYLKQMIEDTKTLFMKTLIKEDLDMSTSYEYFNRAIALRSLGAVLNVEDFVEDILFRPPATIVFWKDGTKTVVKVYNEIYDPEKAFAMAFLKRYMGNNGGAYNRIRKFIEKNTGGLYSSKVPQIFI